ncbi:MAG: ATPase domain-containing protein [Candidatus Diapherotrites archaeon]
MKKAKPKKSAKKTFRKASVSPPSPRRVEVFASQRTKAGIPGMDDLLYGGIPSGNLVVLSGDPGSGKTIFCLTFLLKGIEEYDEPGLYISLEESAEEILALGAEFGYGLEKHIDDKKLKILTVELYDFDKLKNSIEDAIISMKAKRVVVDPGVVFRLFFEKELDARKNILSLAKMLKRLGCTSLITNEINLDETRSLFGLEEYVADGVILLYHTKVGNKFVRSIGVLKMRGTRISEKLHPVQIDKSGVRVLPKQEMFEDVE